MSGGKDDRRYENEVLYDKGVLRMEQGEAMGETKQTNNQRYGMRYVAKLG